MMSPTTDIVELALDAARYRWLRDIADPGWVERIWWCHEPASREKLIDEEMERKHE